MKQLVITLIGILVLIAVAVVVFSGLGKKEEPSPIEEKFRKGVSYSPYTPAAAADFWEKAKQTGEIVRTGGDWLDFGQKGKISQTVVELSRRNNLVPLIEVNFFDQGTGKLLRPLDASNRQAYLDQAVNFARELAPPYLGIGVEIDTFYRASPGDFDAFVSLFSEAYDAVKAVSPKTKIFTTFQLERTRGLRGGLFGGKNDTSKNNWDLLDKFPKADLIAFTTYPGLIYKNPSDIPADYYTEIASRTGKSVAFTEIGWGSGLQ